MSEEYIWVKVYDVNYLKSNIKLKIVEKKVIKNGWYWYIWAKNEYKVKIEDRVKDYRKKVIKNLWHWYIWVKNEYQVKMSNCVINLLNINWVKCKKIYVKFI